MADDGDVRPSKRIRQACEPCRRKKTRCPGEKPNCSFCTRLRQLCTYAEETSLVIEPPPWAEEFSKLDRKLDAIINHFVSPASIEQLAIPVIPNNFQAWIPEANADSHRGKNNDQHMPTPGTDEGQASYSVSDQLPPRNTVLAVSKLYAERCNFQPLPLFRAGELPVNIGNYGWDVLYAILAVALRFREDSGSTDVLAHHARSYAAKSLQLVTTTVVQGKATLGAVQALCLLAFVNLTDGQTQRAWSNIGLGHHLSQTTQFQESAAKTLNNASAEDHHGCLWSLHLLSMMCNSGERIVPSLASKELQYPRSIPKPFHDLVAQSTASNFEASVVDLGIVAYTVQLTAIWQETLRYSKTRLDPLTKSPWLYDSGYSNIVARLMQFETTLPESHRFITGNFSEQDPQSLRDNAAYWGPWLYAQFVYHTIFCLLHHPFLVAQEMKIRSIRFPFTFMDNCAALVQLHSNWIDIFINLIKSKDFPMANPFVAYCASVAASAHIFYLYSENTEMKEQTRSKLRRCYKFISDLALWWPSIKDTAKNLNTLSRRVPKWHRQNPFTPTEFSSADKLLFWGILIYASDEKKQEPNLTNIQIGHNQSSLSNSASASILQLSSINPTTPILTPRMSMDINHVITSNDAPQNSAVSSEFLESHSSSTNLLEDIDVVGVNRNFDGQSFDWMSENANYGFGNYGWPRAGNL